MNSEKIYIILNDKKVVDTNDSLYIRDIGDVYCNNIGLKKHIESIKIYNSKEEDWDYITANEVAKKIIEKHKNIDVNIMGAAETLIEIKSKQPVNNLFEALKLFFVSVILFFGAAMGIIYFHEDVNMSETLSKLYFTFSGEESKNPLIMTIPYSLGLAIGMITFFKRIPSKSIRRRKEPGPLDMELYLYDQNMEQYILNELMKNNDGNND